MVGKSPFSHDTFSSGAAAKKSPQAPRRWTVHDGQFTQQDGAAVTEHREAAELMPRVRLRDRSAES
jgi:hypothetical protein